MAGNFQSMILGVAVGDAMGVPYEFRSRAEMKASPATGIRGYGTHNMPPGTWSDDTSLTLCLVESLSFGLDYRDIASRFSRWLTEGYLTATDQIFDVGIGTRKAIQNFIAGEEPTICGEFDEYSNGNGSLMRISPLAFFLADTEITERRTIVFKVSAITHGHSRSKIACWLYVEILIRLIKGEEKKVAIDEAHLMIMNWLESQKSNELQHFVRCNSSIVTLGEVEIKSTGYVIDSLEAALWAFLRGRSYPKIVLAAVNLGDDTDTVAAIAGSFAGLYYGDEQGIPSDWLAQLKKKSTIIELCEKLVVSLK